LAGKNCRNRSKIQASKVFTGQFSLFLGNLFPMLWLYNKKSIWLSLFILWSLILTVVALYPNSSKVVIETASDFRWDYLEHFLAYFIFGGIYILWRSNSDFSIRALEMFILFAITIAFSMITEYAQVLIPGRTFNIVDMLYNVGGVSTGILFTYFLFIRLYLRKKYIRKEQ
jgi:VanZ family protein